jgi:hypothetical protein
MVTGERFPQDYSGRGVKLTTHLHPVPRSRMVDIYFHSPIYIHGVLFKHRDNFTFIFIHSSMAVQPFVGPRPLLQFRNLFYTDGRTPWRGDQPVARPLPTHRTTQTQNKHTYRYPCLEWDSNPRSSVQASEESSCFRPRGCCDRYFTLVRGSI